MRLKILPQNLKEDENLSYILGVLKGDGHITKDEIQLFVNDKDFALTFKKKIEQWLGKDFKVYFYIYNNEGGGKYQVSTTSKNLVIYLKRCNILKIINLNRLCIISFLQGMYDSEGCVGIGNKQIIICNNDKHLLLLCKKLLKKLYIESNSIRINKKKGSPYTFLNGKSGVTNFNNYSFSIDSKHNLIKFKNLVGFNIKRKQNKLINEINSYLSKKQIKFINSLPSSRRKNWREYKNA